MQQGKEALAEHERGALQVPSCPATAAVAARPFNPSSMCTGCQLAGAHPLLSASSPTFHSTAVRVPRMTNASWLPSALRIMAIAGSCFLIFMLSGT